MEIYKAMARVMAELDPVAKLQRNHQQGYAYRGIDDALNALHPILARNGIFITPHLLEIHQTTRETRHSTVIQTQVRVQYTFWATDGSSVQVVVPGEAMDSGDKSVNKAMSAALKYALIQTFCIPTAEPKDSEVDSYELAPAAATASREPKPENKKQARLERCEALLLELKQLTGSELVEEFDTQYQSLLVSPTPVEQIEEFGKRLRKVVDDLLVSDWQRLTNTYRLATGDMFPGLNGDRRRELPALVAGIARGLNARLAKLGSGHRVPDSPTMREINEGFAELAAARRKRKQDEKEN